MANRRMFSKSITNSSQFLMMPQSSQNLYFHFGMNADDDGFCEHFTIMRMTESKPDDLKVLQAKGFVKVFDDKVLVIIDWKENNYLRSDRYTPSKYLEVYKEEIKQIADNKEEFGIPKGYQRDTQVRIGKDRIVKDNNTLSAIADEVWNFDDFFKEMEDHKRRDFQIMALYWDFKKIRFTNREQVNGEIKRLLRAAKELVAFEDEKIYQTMEWLERNADFAWKLETVRKFITEDLQKLKSFKK